MTDSGGESGRFLPGTLFAGRYRMVALIGRGGMGEVYRADDIKLGQAVALKFLPEAVERDEDQRSRFLGEVRIARQISHPNVCRVYDVGEVDGQYFLTMEYVDGEDLASLLRQIGRLPHEKAVQIARELCAGLNAAHEQGVLHRDLKPANIMIDGRGRVRITDFGLAGLAHQIVGDEARAGTPAYMAPEQFAGEEVTVRTDIYALGLVLFELFTGRPAFRGADHTEVLAFQRQETPPDTPSDLIAGMDPVVERAVMRCLQPDPANRPASVLQLAAALPGGDPLAAALAAGETPSPQLVAEAGRMGGLAPAIAVGCLGVVAAGVLGIAALAPRLRISSMIAPGKPPAVLVERAREIVRSLGYGDHARDSDDFYRLDSGYLQYIAQHDSTLGRWKRLARPSPPSLVFWYRQSPMPLVPLNRTGGFRPRSGDPPLIHSGMLRVLLSPQGDLQSFTIVPDANDSARSTWPEPSWQGLFAAAGLDSTRFVRVPSTVTPPYFADRRVAWRGADPGDTSIPLRIEAAAYHGRPVAFSLMRPWDRPEREGPRAPSGWNIATQIVAIGLLLTCLAGAGLLARRNNRVGRSDRRAAARLGVAYVIFGTLAWVFGQHHVRDPAELEMLFGALAFNIFMGVLIWLSYQALEPYLRRLWPKTMVSWIRLMGGRVRDPLVGRDVLLGCVSGVAFAGLMVLGRLTPPWIGLPPPRPDIISWIPQELGTLLGPMSTTAHVLYSIPVAVLETLLSLVVLVLTRLVLRRPTPSYIVWTILMTIASSSSPDNPGLDLTLTFLQFVLLLVLFLRFGLVTIAAGTLAYFLMAAFPLTLDFGAWNATGGILAMVTLAAFAAYGFLTSLGGRRLFRDILPEAGVVARAEAARPGG